MRVLLIGDAPWRLPGMASRLREAGHVVDLAGLGRWTFDRVALTGIDLLAIDVSVVANDPAQTIAAIRQLDSRLPVVAFGARDSAADRIQVLDAGADDCVSVNQSDEELSARLRVWLRRGMGGADPVISIGPLAFNTKERTAYLAGRRLQLSRRELGVLEVLIRRYGRHVSADALIDKLFEWDEAATPNSIQVYICRLRRKLDHPDISIQTARGLGYVLQTSHVR